MIKVKMMVHAEEKGDCMTLCAVFAVGKIIYTTGPPKFSSCICVKLRI
jgi:hypothetical protein